MTQTSPDIKIASADASSGLKIEAFLRGWWARRGKTVLWILIGLMVIAAAFRLKNEAGRLLFPKDLHHDGVDLKLRYAETVAWFKGKDAYAEFSNAVYPPATYAVLWPLIGWISMEEARWAWMVVLSAGTIWLGAIAARQARGRPLEEATVLFLLPFAMYATAATFSTGQLIIAILPLLLLGLVLIARDNRVWVELIASGAIALALTKLTITLPFMWIILFTARSFRPLLFVCVIYALLTMIALHVQDESRVKLLHEFLANSRRAMYGDFGNLHSWLTALGHEHWAGMASPIAGLLLGVWMWFYRRLDVWMLIAVAALFARMWTYHRLYDDVLALPAMIALYRLATIDDDFPAAIVLAMMVVLALAPAGKLINPDIFGTISRITQSTGWLIGLAFLMYRADGQRRLATA